MKINTKLILILLELTLIPMVIVTFVAYSNAKNQIDTQTVSKLEAVAAIQKDRLLQIIKEDKEKLNLYSADPTLITETAASASIPLKNTLDQKSMLLPSVKEASVANLGGIIIASTNPKLILQNISGQNYFQLGKTAPNVGTFAKDENGIVSHYLSAPITSNKNLVGIIILKMDGSNINSVVSDYEGLGATGETLLVSKNINGDTVFLTPIRFDANAALTRTISKDKTTVPSTHASNGQEVVMLNAVDYSNVASIAVTKYIPGVNWGIVTKVSQLEAYSPVASIFNLLTFMVMLSAIIILLISISVARSFSDPINDLTDFADRVGQGDLSHRVVIKTKDEMGTLGTIFNQTVAKLQESYQELEKKVTQRTEALTQNVKELEEEKRASLNILEDLDVEKTKFEALIESIGDGVIASDEQTKIIFINSTAKRMLKINEDVYGKTLDEALPVVDRNGKLIPLSERPFNKAITAMKPFSTSVESDYYYMSHDGSKIPVALTASPVIAGGKLIGVIDIFRDISHEKDIDRMKTEFVSLASHQLRTPLTAIKWGLEILDGESGNFTERQKSFVKDIESSNDRMIDLVNSLLNISRIESGRIIVNPVPTDIIKLANDVIGKLKVEITNKNINIEMSADEGVPEVPLDYNLIFNVYQNLISNAISYSPTGSKVKVSINKRDGEIISSVADSGIGIPEEEKPHIFEKFYRASNAKQVRPDGSGLGLYIVKSIVESSGGHIWFESESGKGTTFYFTLPTSGMKAHEGEVTLS